ncbi:unnamed protein product [Polarella glacialis]|nr:unnamed protein product [Polarella glacialis]
MRRLPSHIPMARELRKIVYLVRHAEAVHNVQELMAQEEARLQGGSADEMEAARKRCLSNPAFLDASLSAGGQDQVRCAADNFSALLSKTHYPQPEIVFVSPLERTLQTATLLFPSHSQTHAIEFVREKRTGLPCDERKPVGELKVVFPDVDFADIEEADSVSCDGYTFHQGLKESNDAVGLRAAPLLDFLRCQPSDAIAVVTHKGFLRELGNGPWKDILDLEGGRLSSVFGNAEVRVCEIHWDLSGQPSVKAMSLKEATLQPRMVVFSQGTPSPEMFRRHSDGGLPRQVSLSIDVPNGGGLFMAAGVSQHEDSATAAVEAWRKMEKKLQGAATFALVFCQCQVEASVVASVLRAQAGAAVVVGGSSTRGVLTKDGFGRVGIVGFRGLAYRYGVGSSPKASGPDARKAGQAAAKAATRGKGSLPDFIFLCVSPGHEDAVLEGIRDVCGDTPVFGGSTADDSVVGLSPNETWWQMRSDLTGVETLTDGIVLAAIWLYADANVSCFLSHCYSAAGSKGVITKARGRVLSEINGLPAAEVLNEWMEGALQEQVEHGGLVQMQTILSPLAVLPLPPLRDWNPVAYHLARLQAAIAMDFSPERHSGYDLHHDLRLLHVKSVISGGQLECYGAVATGEVRFLKSKQSDVSGALHALTKEAMDRANFVIQGAIVDICAGYASTFQDLQVLLDALPKELPDFFCFFSFGEQGMINGTACHGNLMINVAVFG